MEQAMCVKHNWAKERKYHVQRHSSGSVPKKCLEWQGYHCGKAAWARRSWVLDGAGSTRWGNGDGGQIFRSLSEKKRHWETWSRRVTWHQSIAVFRMSIEGGGKYRRQLGRLEHYCHYWWHKQNASHMFQDLFAVLKSHSNLWMIYSLFKKYICEKITYTFFYVEIVSLLLIELEILWICFVLFYF